ncbi:DUF7144 family membrane protein [Streptomyces sp.]|uniref:DUF7144 family membrane protein n=1 Tax=Streptomyces sp. TaxID=1931 RepID=UPI002F3FA353
MATADIRRDNVAGTGGGGGDSTSEWRSGWVTFAGVMMIFSGTMGILQGVVALASDDIIVVARNYAYKFDLSAWGGLHLALGILVVLAGMALLRTTALWARAVAITAAGLSMIGNFMWLPYYPFWALSLIAIDAFVIWAVCTSGSKRASAR